VAKGQDAIVAPDEQAPALEFFCFLQITCARSELLCARRGRRGAGRGVVVAKGQNAIAAPNKQAPANKFRCFLQIACVHSELL
jgi:hypothetical protein